ncbi:hypothetical protein [Cellulomonas sp.]|uniref:hypothetical protein n=1 Tax=Cellulomonas sp. TaxID=40001 RepID=UPI0025BE3006|nr:hypothetical protein [Cellulomonas sp.]
MLATDLQSTRPLNTSDFVSHHLPDFLLLGVLEPLISPIVPGKKDIRASRPAQNVTFTGGSRLKRSAQFADLVADGWTVVVTHGNGPQVGFILRRGELVAPDSAVEGLPDLPLWLAVAY